MITDYFFKDFIIATYREDKNNIFKIEIYDRKEKKTYRIQDKKLIEKIKGVIKCIE